MRVPRVLAHIAPFVQLGHGCDLQLRVEHEVHMANNSLQSQSNAVIPQALKALCALAGANAAADANADAASDAGAADVHAAAASCSPAAVAGHAGRVIFNKISSNCSASLLHCASALRYQVPQMSCRAISCQQDHKGCRLSQNTVAAQLLIAKQAFYQVCHEVCAVGSTNPFHNPGCPLAHEPRMLPTGHASRKNTWPSVPWMRWSKPASISMRSWPSPSLCSNNALCDTYSWITRTMGQPLACKQAADWILDHGVQAQAQQAQRTAQTATLKAQQEAAARKKAEDEARKAAAMRMSQGTPAGMGARGSGGMRSQASRGQQVSPPPLACHGHRHSVMAPACASACAIIMPDWEAWSF